MKSVDTNILIYASDTDCAEHASAKALMDQALRDRFDWVIAEQVWFEYYKALRNPRVFRNPLPGPTAAERVRFLRDESGLGHCSYHPTSFAAVIGILSDRNFPYQRTHDALLAVTLRDAGVKTFYTRNEKDFANAGFAAVNPIDI
jgi:predicted nucleic acid-binding protein